MQRENLVSHLRYYSHSQCRVLLVTLLTLFSVVIPLAAEEHDTVAQADAGRWLATDYTDIGQFNLERLSNISELESDLSLTGGIYWHLLDFRQLPSERYVLDFKNSSVVGKFTHYIVDVNGDVLSQISGGIQSTWKNEFFLRHGRALRFPNGDYKIITRVESPFFLAQPRPVIYERQQYSDSIKNGNALTLIGLGIFFALGIYYTVLGISRLRYADFFYSIFIMANLIYNATALNFLSDVFGIVWFYSISVPILISNIAYIAFAMNLLSINKNNHSRLYLIGKVFIAVLIVFLPLSILFPNWSLEMARLGVGMFSVYGFSSALYLSIKKEKIARWYLVANIMFVVPAIASIQLQTVSGDSTLFVEHLGLFAVAIEVILLSLVLNYQVGLVYREKEASLKEAEKALETAKIALQAKERFLANISHELRTPLNAIQGSVDLLKREPSANEANEYINVIHSSSDFLLFLINDILDSARIESREIELEEVSFNLSSLVQGIVGITEKLKGNKQVMFSWDVDREVPNLFKGDPNRLKQILANLLNNALKFTSDGRVQLNVKMIDSEQLLFEVIDDGIGIPPDKQKVIFEQFVQADVSISRKYGGSGLGLTIASELVQLMGGHLQVDSIEGSGSRFYFSLPLRRIEVMAPDEKEQDQAPPVSYENSNIIVVDDNLVNLKILGGLLKKIGIDVQLLSDANSAIMSIRETNPDLVFMDVQMPGMDGLQATHMLRKTGFKKPIIAYTANASEMDHKACMDSGMNGILSKPCSLQEIELILGQWLHTQDS